ncbi:MAG: hypothetical protein QOF84_7188, partial [Streptomyces sp.]|nr:hypothetical protein [Streptomyces sp.]
MGPSGLLKAPAAHSFGGSPIGWPEDPEDIPDEEGLGVDATRVPLVVEVVSAGRDAHQRDHERKRRFYATAGVPIYVIIDDYYTDGTGTVTVLT